MKTLILCGATAAAPKALADATAEVVALDETTRTACDASGRSVSLLDERLGNSGLVRVESAARGWARAWGRRPLLDGKSFRELLTWEDLPLWWFAERHLVHSTGTLGHVRTIERFRQLLEAAKPDEVEAVGLPPVEELLLERTCVALGVLFHGRPAAGRARSAWWSWRSSLEARWVTLRCWITAAKAALAGEPAPVEAGPGRVLFLSQAYRRRPRGGPQDATDGLAGHDFGRLIADVEADPDLEGVTVALERGPGPDLDRFSTFAVFARFRAASAQARSLWTRIRGRPALREAFSHAGVRFDDLAAADLSNVLLLRTPWAVLSYERVRVALHALKPALVCFDVDDPGWDGVIESACRRAGIRTLAIRGLDPGDDLFLPVEGDASSPPFDRLVVAGGAAGRLPLDEGRSDPESLVVTGGSSPERLLDLIRKTAREERVLR